MKVNSIDKLRSCVATAHVIRADYPDASFSVSIQEAEEIISYCAELEKAYHKLAKFLSENIGMTDINGNCESQEDWEEWGFKKEDKE